MERPGPVSTTTTPAPPVLLGAANETFGGGGAAGWSPGLLSQVSLAGLLSAITLGTTLSNAFVITVISRSRKLQTPANFLIASLAVTDLLVSVLVMPICVLYTVTHTWSLGQVVCDLWLSSDITCCTASILHLCVIALDRYWAVTDAVEYSARRTRSRAAGMVAGAWLIAVSISLPPFLWRRERRAEEEVTSCTVNTDHIFYTIYSTCGAFYVPTLLLLALYGRLYAEARKVILKNALLEKKRVSAARERRATRTLGVILGAYIGCWLPFFIYTLVVATCDACFYPELFDFFNWLGYLNSLINPVVYTMSNEDFKKAFHRLVRRFRCRRRP